MPFWWEMANNGWLEGERERDPDSLTWKKTRLQQGLSPGEGIKYNCTALLLWVFQKALEVAPMLIKLLMTHW